MKGSVANDIEYCNEAREFPNFAISITIGVYRYRLLTIRLSRDKIDNF